MPPLELLRLPAELQALLTSPDAAADTRATGVRLLPSALDLPVLDEVAEADRAAGEGGGEVG